MPRVIGWLRSIEDGSFTRAQSVTIVRSMIFQMSSPLLVLVEIASADDDIDIPIARTERVYRDGVDLALGPVTV